MYALRLGHSLYASLVLLVASFQVVLAATVPIHDLLQPANKPVAGNPYTQYGVYPENPQRVHEIDRDLRETLGLGKVQRVDSKNRPQYSNVLYWIFTALEDEAQKVKSFLGSDVSLLGASRYPLIGE